MYSLSGSIWNLISRLSHSFRDKSTAHRLPPTCASPAYLITENRAAFERLRILHSRI